jgi:serine/threonine-protein kinase
MLERIEKYRILEEIGQGGMSVVYRAIDEALEREVAVKVLHRHLARDPDARERFAREARAVARLTHPNIPEIFDYSSDDAEMNYLVTELVSGCALSAVVREGAPMLPEVGALICVGVAQALEHAHSEKIIHRDVKPENILMGLDGVVKLTDFGIAQIIGLESMTITGTLVGSPAHMSPEQIDGRRDLDIRADVWALGTVLYVLSTGGSLPFDAPTPHGVLKRIIDGKYEDPRRLNPHVDSDLAGIVGTCLQLDRNARYQNMDEVGQALEQWLEGRGLQSPQVEIAAWLDDAEAANESLSKRLIASLSERAESHLAERRVHRAIEAYGRVLTLEPEHTVALERLRTLHTGQRRRRVAAISTLVGAAVAIAWTTVILWPEPPTLVPPMDAPTLQELMLPTEMPSATVIRTRDPGTAGTFSGVQLGSALQNIPRLIALKNRPTRGKNGKAMGAQAIAKRIPVRVTADPPAVRIKVDGLAVGPGGTLKLTAGKHRAVLTHPACADCAPTVRVFRVPQNPRALPVHEHIRFKYRPTTVRVDCGGGTVRIDGKMYGACGKAYRVAVLSHTPRVGRIEVVFPDGTKKSRSFTMKPGAEVRWAAGR